METGYGYISCAVRSDAVSWDCGGMQVSRNIDLVYGGGSVGLMGLVSQAVHEGGRHVIGYICLTFPFIFSC